MATYNIGFANIKYFANSDWDIAWGEYSRSGTFNWRNTNPNYDAGVVFMGEMYIPNYSSLTQTEKDYLFDCLIGHYNGEWLPCCDVSCVSGEDYIYINSITSGFNQSYRKDNSEYGEVVAFEYKILFTNENYSGSSKNIRFRCNSNGNIPSSGITFNTGGNTYKLGRFSFNDIYINNMPSHNIEPSLNLYLSSSSIDIGNTSTLTIDTNSTGSVSVSTSSSYCGLTGSGSTRTLTNNNHYNDSSVYVTITVTVSESGLYLEKTETIGLTLNGRRTPTITANSGETLNLYQTTTTTVSSNSGGNISMTVNYPNIFQISGTGNTRTLKNNNINTNSAATGELYIFCEATAEYTSGSKVVIYMLKGRYSCNGSFTLSPSTLNLWETSSLSISRNGTGSISVSSSSNKIGINGSGTSWNLKNNNSGTNNQISPTITVTIGDDASYYGTTLTKTLYANGRYNRNLTFTADKYSLYLHEAIRLNTSFIGDGSLSFTTGNNCVEFINNSTYLKNSNTWNDETVSVSVMASVPETTTYQYATVSRTFDCYGRYNRSITFSQRDFNIINGSTSSFTYNTNAGGGSWNVSAYAGDDIGQVSWRSVSNTVYITNNSDYEDYPTINLVITVRRDADSTYKTTTNTNIIYLNPLINPGLYFYNYNSTEGFIKYNNTLQNINITTRLGSPGTITTYIPDGPSSTYYTLGGTQTSRTLKNNRSGWYSPMNITLRGNIQKSRPYYAQQTEITFKFVPTDDEAFYLKECYEGTLRTVTTLTAYYPGTNSSTQFNPKYKSPYTTNNYYTIDFKTDGTIKEFLERGGIDQIEYSNSKLMGRWVVATSDYIGNTYFAIVTNATDNYPEYKKTFNVNTKKNWREIHKFTDVETSPNDVWNNTFIALPFTIGYKNPKIYWKDACSQSHGNSLVDSYLVVTNVSINPSSGFKTNINSNGLNAYYITNPDYYSGGLIRGTIGVGLAEDSYYLGTLTYTIPVIAFNSPRHIIKVNNDPDINTLYLPWKCNGTNINDSDYTFSVAFEPYLNQSNTYYNLVFNSNGQTSAHTDNPNNISLTYLNINDGGKLKYYWYSSGSDTVVLRNQPQEINKFPRTITRQFTVHLTKAKIRPLIHPTSPCPKYATQFGYQTSSIHPIGVAGGGFYISNISNIAFSGTIYASTNGTMNYSNVVSTSLQPIDLEGVLTSGNIPYDGSSKLSYNILLHYTYFLDTPTYYGVLLRGSNTYFECDEKSYFVIRYADRKTPFTLGICGDTNRRSFGLLVDIGNSYYIEHNTLNNPNEIVSSVYFTLTYTTIFNQTIDLFNGNPTYLKLVNPGGINDNYGEINNAYWKVYSNIEIDLISAGIGTTSNQTSGDISIPIRWEYGNSGYYNNYVKYASIAIAETTYHNLTSIDFYGKFPKGAIKMNPPTWYYYDNEQNQTSGSSNNTSVLTYQYGTSTDYNAGFYLGHAYDDNHYKLISQYGVWDGNNNPITYILNGNNICEQYSDVTDINLPGEHRLNVYGLAKSAGTVTIYCYWPETAYFNPLTTTFSLRVDRATLTDYNNYWNYNSQNFTYNLDWIEYNTTLVPAGNYENFTYLDILQWDGSNLSKISSLKGKISLSRKSGSNFNIVKLTNESLNHNTHPNDYTYIIKYISPGTGIITRTIVQNSYYNSISSDFTVNTFRGTTDFYYLSQLELIYNRNEIYSHSYITINDLSQYSELEYRDLFKNNTLSFVNRYIEDDSEYCESITNFIQENHSGKDERLLAASSSNTGIISCGTNMADEYYQLNWVSSNHPSGPVTITLTKPQNTYWEAVSHTLEVRTWKYPGWGNTPSFVNPARHTFDATSHTIVSPSTNNSGTIMWFCSSNSNDSQADVKSNYSSTLPAVRDFGDNGNYYVWWYIAGNDYYTEYNNVDSNGTWHAFKLSGNYTVYPFNLNNSNYISITKTNLNYDSTTNFIISVTGLSNDTDINRASGTFNYSHSTNDTINPIENGFTILSDTQVHNGDSSHGYSTSINLSVKATGKKNTIDTFTWSFTSSNPNYTGISTKSFTSQVIPWAIPFVKTPKAWTWDGNYNKYSLVKVNDSTNKWDVNPPDSNNIYWGLTTNYGYSHSDCINKTDYQLGNQNLADIIESDYDGTTIYFKIDGGNYYLDNTGSVQLYVNRLHLEGPTNSVKIVQGNKYHIFVEEELTLYTGIWVTSKGVIKVRTSNSNILVPTIELTGTNTANGYPQWTLKVKSIMASFDDYIEIYSEASGNHAASNVIRLTFFSGPIENVLVLSDNGKTSPFVKIGDISNANIPFGNFNKLNSSNSIAYYKPDDSIDIYVYTYYDAQNVSSQSTPILYYRGTSVTMTYYAKYGTQGTSQGFVKYKASIPAHRIISNSAEYQLNTIVVNRAADDYRYNDYAYIYYNSQTYSTIKKGSSKVGAIDLGSSRIQFVYTYSTSTKKHEQTFFNPNPNAAESLNHNNNNTDANGLSYYISPNNMTHEVRHYPDES